MKSYAYWSRKAREQAELGHWAEVDTCRDRARKARKIEKRKIKVHVRGGVAYCDDARVEIIDHDNRED